MVSCWELDVLGGIVPGLREELAHASEVLGDSRVPVRVLSNGYRERRRLGVSDTYCTKQISVLPG